MPRDTASNILSGNQAALLRELDALRVILREQNGNVCPDDEPEGLLALLRLCPGLNPEQWPDLAERHGLRDWLAVPLSKREFPFLSRLQKTLEDLAFQTDHDPLTGLLNRRGFERALDHEMERSARSGSALALAMVDIDDFKKVNDTYGHPCGDEALAGLAAILATGVRRYDVAGRLGGEEFGVILPGAGVLKAEAIMQRMVVAVRLMEVLCAERCEPFRITCSVGLVSYKSATRQCRPPDLVTLADNALYQAKAQGKDQVVTVTVTGLEVDAKGTLVDSNEKRFLFTGA